MPVIETVSNEQLGRYLKQGILTKKSVLGKAHGSRKVGKCTSTAKVVGNHMSITSSCPIASAKVASTKSATKCPCVIRNGRCAKRK